MHFDVSHMSPLYEMHEQDGRTFKKMSRGLRISVLVRAGASTLALGSVMRGAGEFQFCRGRVAMSLSVHLTSFDSPDISFSDF